MLRRSLALAFVLLGLTFLLPASASAAPQVHKDERIGFSMRVPKKWTEIPSKSDEVYIATKYVSNKTDYYTRSDLGYTYEHTPTLRVVAFVHSFLKNNESTDLEDAAEGGEGDGDDPPDIGTVVNKIKFFRRFSDYRHFLKETYREGHYATEEETATHKGMPVTQFKFLSEQPVKEANRLIITWIYETGFADVALEFEVLETEYKKYKSEINKVLKSFEVIERTQEFNPLTSIGDVGFVSISTMTPAERAKRRKDQETRLWADMTQNLAEGWTPLEIEGMKVLTRHDERHAKEVVKSIQAVMLWADETFPTIGPDEYVRSPIVRICKDWDEEKQFRGGTGFSMASGTEIVTHKDAGGSVGFEWGYINWRAIHIWFRDRDGELFSALPTWLRVGLQDVLMTAKPKGRKMKYSRNNAELAWQGGDGKQYSMKEMMFMTPKEFDNAPRDDYGIQRPRMQAIALTRFFLDGKGSRGSNKNILTDYVSNVRAVLDEFEEEDKKRREENKETYKAPETEEEEDAERERRNKRNEERREKIMELAFQRTFGGWSPSKFNSLDKAYLKTVK